MAVHQELWTGWWELDVILRKAEEVGQAGPDRDPNQEIRSIVQLLLVMIGPRVGASYWGGSSLSLTESMSPET